MQHGNDGRRLAGAASGGRQLGTPAWEKSPSLIKFAAVFVTCVAILLSGLFNGVALQMLMNQLFPGWQAGEAYLLATAFPYILILLAVLLSWGGLHLARRWLAPVMAVLVFLPAAWLGWAMYGTDSPPELLRREEVIPAILLLLGPYAVRLAWARLRQR